MIEINCHGTLLMLMLTTVNNVAPPTLLIDGKQVLRHFYS